MKTKTYTLDDCIPGTSWACRFRITTFLNEEGEPVRANNLQLGQAHPGRPGVYESLGIIRVRDLDSRRVRLHDTRSGNEYTVGESDIWDIDEVEWQDA
jgi:hypothetical protein